eukprot:11164880-Alexandrium_andersonii.AAC.1
MHACRSGKGAASMTDDERVRLLESRVDDHPMTLGTVQDDERRRQRLIFPMRNPDGQIARRDIFLPIEPDPLFPNGVGLVVKGLHRRVSTPEDV